MKNGSQWHFEWLTSWDEVLSPAFQQRWERFSRDAWNSHVFFHPEMGRAWIDTYRSLRDIQPRFAIGRNGECTVFLPMVLWRRNWKNARLRLIVRLGHSDFDYGDPLVICASNHLPVADFWNAFGTEVRRRYSGEFDQIEMSGIRGPLPAGGHDWQKEADCPWCDLSSFVEAGDFLASISKSLRGDLNRQQRRLAALGKLELHVFAQDELPAAQASLKSLLEWHSRRWPHAYKAAGFHARLVENGLRVGVLHFSQLRVSGRPISWHLGFVWRDRFYYYLPAHDPEFANYSPGKVHLLFCVSDSLKRGVRYFDHLRGEENYKSGWAREVAAVFRVTHENPRWASRVRCLLVRWRAAVSRFGR